MSKTYLADEVYVQDTGFDLRISTQRPDGEHFVHLNNNVMQELIDFYAKARKMKIFVEVDLGDVTKS